MPREQQVGHVVTTKRVYKGVTYSAHLLMQSYREGSKVKKRTLANLTPLGDEIVGVIKSLLKGKPVRVLDELLVTSSSVPHGHVAAVLSVMKHLGIPELLASRSSRERSLVLGLIAQRVLNPLSKLATTRAWNLTSLAAELGITDASEDEVYAAMDWLVLRQDDIEAKLAKRHLRPGCRVLYDLSGSYVEGEHCELAAYGHNRDKKRGKKQINWGLLTDEAGRPVSVRVYPGNRRDSTTVLEQVAKIKDDFELDDFVLVGDRGMITGKQVKVLRDTPGVDWITALGSNSLKPLVKQGVLQPSLFDETNLVSFTHASYPGERLIACFNPLQAAKRAHVRQELLDATLKDLTKLQGRVERGTLTGAKAISLAVGKVLGKRKMGKHLQLDIGDTSLSYRVNEPSVELEARADGIYVLRTSLSEDELTAADAVRAYKRLAEVERVFRTSKGIELLVRPIHHHLSDRVRAHFFLCLLAYYVRWHMEGAWAPLTFKDEHDDPQRDPVQPAQRSPQALRKAQTGTLPDGTATHSFQTLLASLATISRNQHHYPSAPQVAIMTTTTPNPQQQQALDLLDTITP